MCRVELKVHYDRTTTKILQTQNIYLKTCSDILVIYILKKVKIDMI